ncbi:LLM class F420-dependent oxidoreductase [Saccharothrix obliqua]|uniref:LLM class F420-dependent oxidoreductase n=1 Tax=Saccharothrix obliqua TaxID=2861747 RepID=UPI001C5FA584|nr:LLM class F420-dependent oxidoreductase [Saccharothrix obliqua]MBW4718288.1 LLM class F420-dependent oxidoreductase [Saccharothrix obliqua]
MKLSVHFPNFSLVDEPGALAGAIADTARAADETGFATFTVMDHYFQMEVLGGPPEPVLEGYTTLGYVAAVTERITLGTLVSGVTYRHPGLLAKIVATLDVLSGGRALLGLGAAWYEREHIGLGVPYPPVAERFERLEEALRVCEQMWSDDDGPFEGKHYHLAETVCVPRPLRRPPVLIGGSGERKTLRLVARYADACNLFESEVADVERKVGVLARHCADIGRDPATIEKTLNFYPDPLDDVSGFLSTMGRYAELGIGQVWLTARTAEPGDWVRRIADVVGDRVAAL